MEDIRITKIKKWNRLEDQILLNLTNNKLRKNWKYVSKILCTDKSARDCRERFLEISSIIKGRWSQEEDQKLKDLILKNGQKLGRVKMRKMRKILKTLPHQDPDPEINQFLSQKKV